MAKYIDKFNTHPGVMLQEWVHLRNNGMCNVCPPEIHMRCDHCSQFLPMCFHAWLHTELDTTSGLPLWMRDVPLNMKCSRDAWSARHPYFAYGIEIGEDTVLETSFSEKVSSRIRKMLKDHKVFTMEDLRRSFSRSEYGCWKGCGDKTKIELQAIVTDMINLYMEADRWRKRND